MLLLYINPWVNQLWFRHCLEVPAVVTCVVADHVWARERLSKEEEDKQHHWKGDSATGQPHHSQPHWVGAWGSLLLYNSLHGLNFCLNFWRIWSSPQLAQIGNCFIFSSPVNLNFEQPLPPYYIHRCWITYFDKSHDGVSGRARTKIAGRRGMKAPDNY